MGEVILDTLNDGLKLLPFLFVAFLIIEYFEHKITSKSLSLVQKSGKFGPFIGSLVGVIPQCGFSVLATNLYVARIITLGTLIAVYLSTSDEMLPILIAEKADISIILFILLLKVCFGIIFGFIIDKFFFSKSEMNYGICEKEHCDCEHHFFKSALIHTLKTFFFVILITFVLNLVFYFLGDDFLKNMFSNFGFGSLFIMALIGLIPNCASSIAITELFLSGVIPLSAAISGLLSSSGLALLVLFKSNKNFKENIFIVSILYLASLISGILVYLFEVLV